MEKGILKKYKMEQITITPSENKPIELSEGLKPSLKDTLIIAVEKLNFYESERLKAEGYTNECFFNSDGSLTNEYTIKLIEKQKYFYLNFGTSGAFMVSKENIKGFPVGSVFNIKGYGTPNFNKWYGVIFELDIKKLHSLRWDYRR